MDLKNFSGSTQDIAKAFSEAAASRLSERAQYVRTLDLLREQVEKMQNAGVTHIGIEVLDYSQLQSYQMIPNKASDVYALLTVYDACFIARINDDFTINLHMSNVNKLHTNISDLKNEKNISKRIANLKMTPRSLDDYDIFNPQVSNKFNLADAESTKSLLWSLIETAAFCDANNNLRKSNLGQNGIFR